MDCSGDRGFAVLHSPGHHRLAKCLASCIAGTRRLLAEARQWMRTFSPRWTFPLFLEEIQRGCSTKARSAAASHRSGVAGLDVPTGACFRHGPVRSAGSTASAGADQDAHRRLFTDVELSNGFCSMATTLHGHAPNARTGCLTGAVRSQKIYARDGAKARCRGQSRRQTIRSTGYRTADQDRIVRDRGLYGHLR